MLLVTGFGKEKAGREEHTVHTKGMLFQFITTRTASNTRLVRPGPVTKFLTIVFQSTRASDRLATAAEPAPMGRRYARAFAEAIFLTAASLQEAEAEVEARIVTRWCADEERRRVARAAPRPTVG